MSKSRTRARFCTASYRLALGMLCIASLVTSGCGVTGDLYLPEQAGSPDAPAGASESEPQSMPENSTETLPDTTE